MESLDARGKSIELGAYVRYTGTGTSGIVEDIKFKDQKTWIKLENNDLLYLSDYLEIVSKSESNDKVILSDSNKDVVGEVKDIKNVRDNLENFAMETNVGEGGG
ncbi:MAG: DUF2098 domain-containing protein [Methanobacteriaceae archaeon]